MKINETPLLPMSIDSQLRMALSKFWADVAKKINQVAAGNYRGFDNALTAAPTTGTWAQGDWVRNSNPTEAGSASSKYVIHGWICTVGGTPGTWLDDRRLTGN